MCAPSSTPVGFLFLHAAASLFCTSLFRAPLPFFPSSHCRQREAVGGPAMRKDKICPLLPTLADLFDSPLPIPPLCPRVLQNVAGRPHCTTGAAAGEYMPPPKRGQAQPVELSLERRQGRKACTLVRGLETFGIHPEGISGLLCLIRCPPPMCSSPYPAAARTSFIFFLPIQYFFSTVLPSTCPSFPFFVSCLFLPFTICAPFLLPLQYLPRWPRSTSRAPPLWTPARARATQRKR